MSITDLLKQATSDSDEAPLAPVARPAPPPETRNPVQELKDRAQDALFGRLGNRLYDASMSEDQLHAMVVQELDAVLLTETVPLTDDERHRLVTDISDNILGLGPIEPYLSDPSVTEVMANGDDAIYIERAGRIVMTDARFNSTTHLRQVIERIVTAVGRRIDESSPMVDARLPDGSRVNAVVPPLAVDGPMLTIRKFSHQALKTQDLLENHTLSDQFIEFINAAVEGKLNILVTGGTGTGKTTLLNVVSSFIPEDQRIVTIEDAVELRLHQRHVIRLESRPKNIEGKGEITIRDLVRNALRMRPDRIIVGEVRGAEALDMLQAMNTGHEGSLSTLHANSPRDALSRLETMVLMAGVELPLRAIREQVASAIDVIVHLNRLRDGTRRVVGVDEVVGMEGDTVTLSDIYRFNFHAGFDEHDMHQGTLEPTGIRPGFSERLLDAGIDLSAEVLGATDISRARRR